MRVRSSVVCPLLLAASALVYVGCGEAGGPSSGSVASASPPGAQAVSTNAPASGVLRVAGVVRSAEAVRIRSRVEGTAAEVAVREGDSVTAGDLLVLVENAELMHLVDRAKGALADARARANETGADAKITALQRATSLRESELWYESSVLDLEVARYEGVRIVENDQAKNMAFSATDIARSQSNLDRALNERRQSELRREASETRGAAIAINLAKTERARQRMEELESKNYVSTSAVEEAQLSHASAVTRSEEHKNDLEARDEDVKAADDRITAARRILAIWEEAMGHGKKSFEGMSKARDAINTRSGHSIERSDARREANRESVTLDAERTAHTAEAAAAAVRTAEAVLHAAEQQVEWLRIVAPTDGVIGRLNIAPGELVRSGTTGTDPGPPLLTLSNPDRLVARVRVPAARLAGVVLGASVRVTASGASGKAWSGEVTAVDASEDDAHMYIATVTLPEADGSLPLGSVVEIEFP